MDISYSSYQNGASKEADFQKLSQTIATSIQKISQNVSSMQRMVNQLGTSQETSQMKTQLHEIQHYTQQLAKDTSTNLKDLSKIPYPQLQSEQRQWKMQKERLTDEFTTALNHFQQAQRSAHQREKEILQRKRADSGLAYNLSDPGSGGNKYSDHLIELQDHTSKQQQTQQMLQDEMDLQALEERAQAIRQLESDILDVNQIFKDLGQLVHDQGETVDSIEAHVELASTQISEGAQQLRMASESQTKLRKRKLCLLITFIVVLLILILIIWLNVR